MIKRLLVPLDGSKVAERALVVAGGLAESLAATVVLVRVVPPPVPGRFYKENLLEQVESAHVQEAETYLAALAKRLREDRLAVETHVFCGPVASTLVREGRDQNCDLVVLSSQGAGGAGWQLFGSVALKLLHAAPCPVLVVKPSDVELESEEEAEEERADEALLNELSRLSSQQRIASQ